MASKMLCVAVLMIIMAADLSFSRTRARTLSSMENMKSADMEKTFFHPFLPHYGLGHGGPFFGGGVVKGGGGLGGGLGFGPGGVLGGGFGSGLGLGSGDDDELGSHKVGHNGGDENNKDVGAGGDLGNAGADQGLP